MCGDNMLKIDVKKTLENGGENGMIEESAITISHSTRLVSFFCSLVFSNFNFFLRYFSVFLSLLLFLINFCHKITHLRYGLVVTYLVARKSFICSRLDVFMRHDCNASTPVKFNYLTIFCASIFESHFLAFHFRLVSSLVPAVVNKIPWSQFFSKFNLGIMDEYIFTSIKFFYLSLIASPLVGLKIPAKIQ